MTCICMISILLAYQKSCSALFVHIHQNIPHTDAAVDNVRECDSGLVFLSESEGAVMEPGSYPAVTLFFYVCTETDTVWSWSTEFVSRSFCYCGGSLFNAVPRVCLLVVTYNYEPQEMNRMESRILFISSLHSRWKLAESNTSASIISKYLFTPNPTWRVAPGTGQVSTLYSVWNR